MTGIILQILRNWFSINNDDYIYIKDEPVRSTISIKPAYDFTPEDCQSRPGVYIKRGVYRPRGGIKASIDDKVSVNRDSIDYLTIPECTMIVQCVAKQPAEVDRLANNVYEPLLAMSPVIKRDFDFHNFDIVGVSPVEKIEEYKDFYRVSLQIDTRFEENWRLKQISPVLKRVILDAYTKLNSEYSDGYSDKDYSNGEFGTT